MVRHIVAWSFREEFSQEQNKSNAERVKTELEALRDIIQGVIELKVYTSVLGGRDVVLTSLFESESALEEYQQHPAHKQAGAFIGSVLKDRVCVDYIE